MRKNRLLLCVALMLVFAMSLAMFVACADDQTEQPVDPGTTDTHWYEQRRRQQQFYR